MKIQEDNTILPLVNQWKKNKDKKILELLLAKHFAFIKQLAQKYSVFVDEEDLVQEGVKGFLMALETYDPTINSNLLTYAGEYVKGIMLKYLKSEAMWHDTSISQELDMIDCFFDGYKTVDIEEMIIKKDFIIKLHLYFLHCLDQNRKKGEHKSTFKNKEAVLDMLFGIPGALDKITFGKSRISQIRTDIINLIGNDVEAHKLWKEFYA